MINNVILMGRLTANPETRQTNSGATSCRFTVAVDRGTTSPTGERQTDFISCTAWNKTAEFMTKFMEKGSMIIVEGQLRTSTYPDKKYPDVTHYATDVWASRVSFGESKAAHDLAKQNSANRTSGNYGGGYSGNQSYNANPAQKQGGNANPFDNFPPQMGGLSDFEEVISDSDLPF
jgi:single-strand DNA-binding protein